MSLVLIPSALQILLRQLYLLLKNEINTCTKQHCGIHFTVILFRTRSCTCVFVLMYSGNHGSKAFFDLSSGHTSEAHTHSCLLNTLLPPWDVYHVTRAPCWQMPAQAKQYMLKAHVDEYTRRQQCTRDMLILVYTFSMQIYQSPATYLPTYCYYSHNLGGKQ